MLTHFDLSTYWWEQDLVAPTLRISVFFLYFLFEIPSRHSTGNLCRDTRNFVCLIYSGKRASGNIWCIDRETESRPGGHYARFRIVRKIAKEFIELNDNSCGYFGSCN